MATKLLTTSQLSSATYGKFTRAGVTVDVKRFLSTNSGQRLIKDLRAATTGSTVKPVQSAKPSTSANKK